MEPLLLCHTKFTACMASNIHAILFHNSLAWQKKEQRGKCKIPPPPTICSHSWKSEPHEISQFDIKYRASIPKSIYWWEFTKRLYLPIFFLPPSSVYIIFINKDSSPYTCPWLLALNSITIKDNYLLHLIWLKKVNILTRGDKYLTDFYSYYLNSQRCICEVVSYINWTKKISVQQCCMDLLNVPSVFMQFMTNFHKFWVSFNCIWTICSLILRILLSILEHSGNFSVALWLQSLL